MAMLLEKGKKVAQQENHVHVPIIHTIIPEGHLKRPMQSLPPLPLQESVSLVQQDLSM